MAAEQTWIRPRSGNPFLAVAAVVGGTVVVSFIMISLWFTGFHRPLQQLRYEQTASKDIGTQQLTPAPTAPTSNPHPASPSEPAPCRDLLLNSATAPQRSFSLCPISNHQTGPVIVWLHCFGCQTGVSPNSMLGSNPNLVEMAWKEGFNLVLPHGLGDPPSWNAGPCCGDAKKRNLDDTGFIRQLTKQLLQQGFSTFYLGGFSNGGFLASLVAQEAWASEVFAGYVMLAGHQYTSPVAKKPAPVMIQHGTKDTMVRFKGCCGAPPCCCDIVHKYAGNTCVSAQDVAQFWATNNRCSDGGPDSQTHMQSWDNSSVCQQFTDCAVPTVFCVRDADHFLPNLPGVLSTSIRFFSMVHRLRP